MQASELKSLLNQDDYQAVILSYADANHYLVGAQNSQGDYHMLCTERHNLKPFNSLREAENALAMMGVRQAHLKLHSAYEEMGPEELSGFSVSTMEIRSLPDPNAFT